MRIVVLVPRRADNGRRDVLWAYVRARWESEHPDWPIYEGHHDQGPFNRSAAINSAARAAGDWDIAIIADSDSFVGADQIEEAVSTCARTRQMTLGYTTWRALDESMSDRVMAGFDGDWLPGNFVAMTDTCSSMVLVTRDLWEQTGGFDERHQGWGCEDISFAHAARTFGYGWNHTPGSLWHLWHESSPRGPELVAANVALADRYHAAAGNPEAMRVLIAERT